MRGASTIVLLLVAASTATAQFRPPSEFHTAPTPPVAPPEILTAPAPSHHVDLDAIWDNGLHFRSDDGAFNVHVGGNAQVDANWLIGPQGAFLTPSGTTSGVGNASGLFLRRVRFRIDGSLYDRFDFAVEYDFANANNENDGLQPASFNNIAGSPAPANIWIQIRDVPCAGRLRFGNVVKPIGMTNNTSQIFLPFMERADNMDAFYGPFDGGFNLGLVALNNSEDERLTWQVGAYGPAINVYGLSLNKFEWGGRITGLPIFENDGEQLVHLGFGTLNGEMPSNALRIRARTALRNGPGYLVPVLVDTGTLGGSRQYTLAPEFAAIRGPWSLQAEWCGQFLTQATLPGNRNQGTAFFQGGYAQILYFLTGETQPYDKEAGSFGRVLPRSNFTGGGSGAWQVGLRYSYLDLNDRAIQGGYLYGWTLALNWYLNPNVKVQWNAIAERRNQPGVPPQWITGVGVRGGVDF